MRRMILITALFVCFQSVHLFAEITPAQIRENYRDKVLLPQESFWTGSYYYAQGSPDKKYRVTGFGIPKDFETLLSVYPRAALEVTNMKKALVPGSIFFWSGFGLEFGGILGMYAPYNGTIYPAAVAVGLGVAVLGLIFEFIGAAQIVEARNFLTRAVWEYNREVIFEENKLGSSKTSPLDIRLSFLSRRF